MKDYESNIANDEKNILINELLSFAEKNNYIEPSLFEEYGVKRGLRNKDGTGVLVGLTQIGEVHGYIMDEGHKIPVEGRLRYRGIDIEDIVKGCQTEKRFGFEEVCFLLLFGKLPNKDELKAFNQILAAGRNLPDGFVEDVILKGSNDNIMNKLATCILACYSYEENPDNLSIDKVLSRCIDLIARVPSFIAYSYMAKCHYRNGESLHIHFPEANQSTAECILRMIRPDCSFTQLEAETLDLALMLHAEHGGGNNSTFVTRVVTSTGTDTYSAIAAAACALKGPKHGGANAKVMDMIDDIKANVSDWRSGNDLRDYITKIINKEVFDRSGLVYGMGHAVYTLSDPRAVLLKEKAAELAAYKNMEDEFNLYDNIERITPGIFSSIKGDNKALCANVDFYSGFVYKMLGIPRDLFTPLFAAARTPGWCAHSLEELISGGRIIRPAYRTIKQTGNYIPLNQR